MPTAKTNKDFVSEIEAFAVLKAPGGFVAYKLTVRQNGPLTREALCDPCHKSLAYQYLIERVNQQLVRDMVQDATQTGGKQA